MHIQRSNRAGTLAWVLGIGAALGLASLALHARVRRAEAEHPPRGRFIEVEGVRLHYLERGAGEPLVLLHGNGTMAEDFELSGLLDMAANRYRVIAFDRPGYGYSARPRARSFSPAAQAGLLQRALQALKVEQPVVVGGPCAWMRPFSPRPPFRSSAISCGTPFRPGLDA